jgi:protein phosphatase
MLESFSITDTGRVRTNNEDFCREEPELGLFVLADGMGGANAGERASRLAVDTVFEIVAASGRRDSQVLLSAVEEANRRVIAAAANDPRLEGMGTTLVAALESGDCISIASVGDSRAYLMDESGLRVITEDQTWINDVGRPLGLDEESLRNHPMRHVLTMAIGAGAPLAINYYAVRLRPAALLLICSDGLHGVLDPARIEEILRERYNNTDSLEEKGRHLIDAARDAGGPDNITAVLVRAPAEAAPQ